MSGADASDALVLGVDGGGSRCAAVLARVPPAGGVLEILGRGRGGPANPRVAGHDVARDSITAAMMPPRLTSSRCGFGGRAKSIRPPIMSRARND